MRALEGYFEDGRFHMIGQTVTIPGRRRAFLTILDEPAKEAGITEKLAALAEFDRLVAESMHEELRDEDFPRVRFGRELITFSDEGQ